jgi:hypothetical protein
VLTVREPLIESIVKRRYDDDSVNTYRRSLVTACQKERHA